MKVLFDQNIPKDLRPHLPRHTIPIANEIGWAETANGDLLKAAEAAAFEVLVTADQGVYYQHNNRKRKIALFVLNTNHRGRISRQVDLVTGAVDSAVLSGFRFIEFGPLRRKPTHAPRKGHASSPAF